jgi:hypothetical protein
LAVDKWTNSAWKSSVQQFNMVKLAAKFVTIAAVIVGLISVG